MKITKKHAQMVVTIRRRYDYFSNSRMDVLVLVVRPGRVTIEFPPRSGRVIDIHKPFDWEVVE